MRTTTWQLVHLNCFKHTEIRQKFMDEVIANHWSSILFDNYFWILTKAIKIQLRSTENFAQNVNWENPQHTLPVPVSSSTSQVFRSS